MDNKEKKRIKRQLESLNVTLEKQNDESIALSAVSVCRELLKMVAGMSVSQFGQTAFDVIYAENLSIAQCVEELHKDTVARSCQNYESNTQNSVIQNLKLAIMEANADSMTYDEATHEWQMLKQANLKTETEIAQLQASIQSEKKRSVTLQNSKNGAMQKAMAQKESNETLVMLLEEQKKNHARLEKEEAELLRQNEKVQKAIDQTQEMIDALPRENKELLRCYEEKKEELQQLQRAETEFGAEQREMLEKEIAELRPIVEDLQATHDDLKKRLDQWKTQKISFDRKNQMLATNILDLAQSSLSSLTRVLDEHHEALLQVKEKADELSEKTARCMSLRDGYRDWFGTQETPLKAMMRALSLPESTNLKATLDVGTLDNVKILMDHIKTDLESLDSILQACSVAVREDRKNILRRTHI